MQAKPDFISVKVLTFIFIKWFSFYFKIEHIIYILEEKLPMIMERRL